MRPIVYENNTVLRQKAQSVPVKEINSREIQKTISEMSQALAGEKDGVALAAPQIGIALQIFIVASKIFGEDAPKEDLVFINPEITDLSEEMEFIGEGCLSVPEKYGKVKRHKKATVSALDKDGKQISVEGEGLLAQIFQHEIDHLNGVLFTDKAIEIQDKDTVVKTDE